MDTSKQEGRIALVTGGSGFLGQHIVKLLHEKGTNIKEIRTFDLKPYQQMMDFKPTKPERHIVGDIRNKAEVQAALQGVDTVFHTAGLISFGTHPDYEGMEQVNVKGTENVLASCIEEGVTRVVNTSTIDVVVGEKEIVNGDEDTPVPETFLFPGYPDTKHRAETMVKDYNGRETSTGTKLCTVSLRPNVMYGEFDQVFIPNALRDAKKAGGTVRRVGDCTAQFQTAYVGNVAWAHLVAASAMESTADRVGGHAFFITDDTPTANAFDIMETYLKPHGMTVSEDKLRFTAVYSLVYVLETLCVWLRPLIKFNAPIETCQLTYLNNTYTFNRSKAEKLLGYKPLYSFKESTERAMEFYNNINIDQL